MTNEIFSEANTKLWLFFFCIVLCPHGSFIFVLTFMHDEACHIAAVADSYPFLYFTYRDTCRVSDTRKDSAMTQTNESTSTDFYKTIFCDVQEPNRSRFSFIFSQSLVLT